ncbi:MAG: hypothetical protein ACYCXW_09135 [Solirubrobacteraceae bacterium]
MSELADARALYARGLFVEAAQAASRAISTRPRDPAGWCLMASAWLKDDKPREALAAARAAAGLAPADDLPYRLISRALRALGRAAEAVESALEAVHRRPDGWAGHVELAHSLALVPGRGSDAMAAAARAVALAPNRPAAHVAAGAAAASAGHEQAAHRAYARAANLASGTALGALARRSAGSLPVTPASAERWLQRFLLRVAWYTESVAIYSGGMYATSWERFGHLTAIVLLGLGALTVRRHASAQSPELRRHTAQTLLETPAYRHAGLLLGFGTACVAASILTVPGARTAFALPGAIAGLAAWTILRRHQIATLDRAGRRATAELAARGRRWGMVIPVGGLAIIAPAAVLRTPHAIGLIWIGAFTIMLAVAIQDFRRRPARSPEAERHPRG